MAKVRVVAALGNNYDHQIPFVNVVTTTQAGAKKHDQLTPGQTVIGTHKTVQPTASLVPGLPTILIEGYSGPN